MPGLHMNRDCFRECLTWFSGKQTFAVVKFRRVKDGCAAVDRAALCWSLTQSSTRVLQQTPGYLQERSRADFIRIKKPSQHQEPLSLL